VAPWRDGGCAAQEHQQAHRLSGRLCNSKDADLGGANARRRGDVRHGPACSRERAVHAPRSAIHWTAFRHSGTVLTRTSNAAGPRPGALILNIGSAAALTLAGPNSGYTSSRSRQS